MNYLTFQVNYGGILASEAKRLPSNSSGSFYVDDTCIDCGTCRWMAPESFDKVGDYSRVYAQPVSTESQAAALRALVACPTVSIGAAEPGAGRMATAMFPHLIADDVYFCGYHSEASFGATSYFIRRPWGNVLVDSPRFAAPLVRRLEELGGISHLVLTHVDDVADHQKFRDHFDCVRVMHRGDYREQLAGVELWLDGSESVSLAPGFTLWPSPGHTEGSICLHVEDKFLFTGDTLAWQRDWEQVYAFRRACWYDWSILVDSVERLKALPFRWLLPGHGAPIELAEGTSSVEMQRCLDWMRTHGS